LKVVRSDHSLTVKRSSEQKMTIHCRSLWTKITAMWF